MKLIAAIGVVVILILTVLLIIFRTNLIVNHKKTDNSDSNSTSNSVSNTGSNTNTGSNDTGSNTGSNPNPYEDPEEDNSTGVSDAAKNRTKYVERLNKDEKEYVIKENVRNVIIAQESLQKDCSKYVCIFDVQYYNLYSNSDEYGRTLKNCSGKFKFQYFPDEKDEDKKYVYDFSDLKCK